MKVSILREKKENEGEYFEKKILKMKMSILKKNTENEGENFEKKNENER